MQRNPFDEIEDLFDRMGRSFEESGLARFQDISLDVVDHDDEIEVIADLPGFEKDDLDVSVQGRQLTIAAEHEESSDVDTEQYVRRERSHRSVSRSLTLPTDVLREEITAAYQNGVLTVTLPKAEPGADSTEIDIE
ncbi:Hsp20/alpha crystallin family protein [Haloferax mediterranei ATCC 33500]|uniref:Heat-shock protein Hsp20 n=1 Tax=Haloferax mediterranei (strain ATCC 33500 / DSM 1411 / JCM 8866 / NBRC 14739 / NCIMB 2177 / R-4) TaxID=523841 RepID=I3R1P1_HALMT|nr:archaeal heat shock protein Hsp14 [Haloferax mediterranei]AFK18151.1 hsp20-type chaperone [Haloferax mediterranei ATCC 33500]AHZ22441.1 heat-shock protein Hsp20 [Haloferax mediterranei ATCC 33500]EMA02576.1 hsp20-type chaperone [Haloferax mediterranei ATCC 33500]MDX5988241.1 archaeal heat shock protein Hsp14 [Haloferax mediterranei ATCC 33500]QCQ74683.1 Hsp20/alpha crystallin family protein [Haloferax mediterranei ATCC 33500]